MSPVQYGKMPGSGWVCTNNRCWLGLSRIMCFVAIEAELKTRKCQGNGGVYIKAKKVLWLFLPNLKIHVVKDFEFFSEYVKVTCTSWGEEKFVEYQLVHMTSMMLL
jgi:hypothetical protein